MSTWRGALFTASEMRLAEQRYAGETLELMERAGRACAEAAVARFPRVTRWAVHCGSGANGGDGFVAARHLERLGRSVSLILHPSTDRLSGDTSANYRRCTALGIQPVESWRDADGVIDALLGTGYEGELRPGVAAVIDEINDHGCPVVSVDIPSGVVASTGEVDTTAVRADLTVTFHARKVGHVVAPGSQYVGQVVVANIGLDPVADSTTETRYGHVSDAIVAAIPVRGRSDNKYAAGSVLVVGGSQGMTGAPALSALAALRTGAGLVAMCVPRSLNHVFELQALEVMTRPCDDENGTLTEQSLGTIVDASERSGAVVVGPGMGRSAGVQRLVRDLLERLSLPVVLDADGLWALEDQPQLLVRRTSATVLTPHAGELGRLLGQPSAWVDAHRLSAADQAAEASQSVVVLKGADTIVATPDQGVVVCDLGTPGLATAGSGDVLAGILGAALAKGMSANEAAAAGVALAGVAAQRAGRRTGMPGLIASDVIHELPSTLAAAHGLPGHRAVAGESVSAEATGGC